VNTEGFKATFIMEREITEPQVFRMERTKEEKQRRHNEGDKGAKFSAAKEMKPRKDGVSNTLTSSTNDNFVCERWRIRKLTPRECGRLMGCDDETIDKMIAAGIPKTQLYKLYGNSIVCDVLEAIFSQLFIDQSNKSPQQSLF